MPDPQISPDGAAAVCPSLREVTETPRRAPSSPVATPPSASGDGDGTRGMPEPARAGAHDRAAPARARGGTQTPAGGASSALCGTNVPSAGSRPGSSVPRESLPAERDAGKPARAVITSPARAGSGQAAIAAAMSEDRGPDSLDAHVRRLMKDLNLRGYHTHDSRRSQGGYPDWTIVGHRGLLFRELKREGKDPTRAQKEWLDDLAAAGQDSGVWRPSDLLSGRVARELTAISYLAGAIL